MPNPLLLVIGVVVGAALGALIAYVWLGSVRRQRELVSTAEREKLLSDAETQMKEMVLEAKEEAHRIQVFNPLGPQLLRDQGMASAL